MKYLLPCSFSRCNVKFVSTWLIGEMSGVSNNQHNGYLPVEGGGDGQCGRVLQGGREGEVLH